MAGGLFFVSLFTRRGANTAMRFLHPFPRGQRVSFFFFFNTGNSTYRAVALFFSVFFVRIWATACAVALFFVLFFAKNGFNTTLFPGGPPPQY